VFNNPTNPRDLFEKYKLYLCEDYFPRNQNQLDAESIKNAINLCMNKLESFFKQHGKTYANFNLPKPIPVASHINQDIDREKETRIGNEMKSKCNSDQLFAIESILNAVKDTARNAKAFFIDAPGGCGKTFVYSTVRGEEKHVLSVAWTGIAAILLLDGRTVHNAFQLPFTLLENATWAIT